MTTSLKKGDFAVSRSGFLCHLQRDVSEGVHYDLVSDYENGCGVTCGGSCIGGSPADLSPINTTEHFILSRAYAAKVARDEAKAEAARQDEIFKIHVAALKAHKDAERASAAVSVDPRKEG